MNGRNDPRTNWTIKQLSHIGGFQSRNRTAMLVHKTIANDGSCFALQKSQIPKRVFSLLFCAPNGGKDVSGFEPMTFAMPVQCSHQMSYKATQI